MAPANAPSRKAIYGLAWAHHTCTLAIESHPRGWDIVMQLSGLRHNQLAFLLACGDPGWAQLRRMAHIVENWENRARILKKPWAWTETNVRALIDITFVHNTNSLAKYLTGKIRRLE